MIRQRVRIRFTKQGDLRLISHRDLARALERLFRRAGLKLGMTQGFHPRPKMSFPAALSVGIAANAEIAEFVFAEEATEDELKSRLNQHAPEGLNITSVELLEPNHPKVKVKSARYELAVPAERVDETQQKIDELLNQTSYVIQRKGRAEPLDLRPEVENLELADTTLKMQLRIAQSVSARPREVLAALNLDDLETTGQWLTRTMVELVS